MSSSGEIVEVGSNVKDFHPGDIVSGEGHVVCGRCRNCLAGRRHLCKDTQGVGVNRPGGFAEYIAAADDQRLGASTRISTATWQAIFDPFGNAVHTALSFPVLGEDVLITGAGPIGLHGRRRRAPRGRPATSSSPTSIPTGWNWPGKMGVTLRRRRAQRRRWRTCRSSSA